MIISGEAKATHADKLTALSGCYSKLTMIRALTVIAFSCFALTDVFSHPRKSQCSGIAHYSWVCGNHTGEEALCKFITIEMFKL